MKYYQIYGLNVKSDFELKGAYEIDRPVEIHVTVTQEAMEEKYTELMPIEYERELGYGFVSQQEQWTCARFRGFAVFIIKEGNKINYHLYEGYDHAYVSKLIMEYCMIVLAYQRSMLLIHGSGIYYKGKTLIISGVSGAGKSSLADEFMERGYQLMTDDVVAINQEPENIYAYSSFPMRKLCVDAVERKGLDKETLVPIQDMEREKYGICLKDEYRAEKAPLGAMVIVQKADVENPIIEEVVGVDKLKYLTDNFFRRESFKRIPYPKESFMKAVKVANMMPIYVITRPENQITVKQQADMVERILENPDR